MYICSLWGNSIKHNSWATYCYTLYYKYNHLLCHLLLRRPVVMFYTHSPASSPIAMLNVQRFCHV